MILDSFRNNRVELFFIESWTLCHFLWQGRRELFFDAMERDLRGHQGSTDLSGLEDAWRAHVVALEKQVGIR